MEKENLIAKTVQMWYNKEDEINKTLNPHTKIYKKGAKGSNPRTLMAKTQKKKKSELTGIKTYLVFTAVFNIVGVAGLFLAGYGTASLPAPIANFLLSQMFVYLLNGVLALGVVLCFVAISKVNKYAQKAASRPAEKPAEKAADEDMPEEITADDILRVANANHADELAEKAQAASATTGNAPETNVSLDDILGHEDNPFVTDVRQNQEPQMNQDDDVPATTILPAEPAATAVSEPNYPEAEAGKEAEEIEPEAEATVTTDVSENIPELNELEQMLKEALVKMQIPTALYGIEEDKEGAVCFSCNPKDGEWYVYDIKGGKMVDFVFFAKEKGKTAGKVFLERVTKKMNS